MESSSARKGLREILKSVKHNIEPNIDSRVFVIRPNGVRHPFFIGFLQRETRTTCIAEDNGEKNQSMERSRDDEREPHPEVIDLIVLR